MVIQQVILCYPVLSLDSRNTATSRSPIKGVLSHVKKKDSLFTIGYSEYGIENFSSTKAINLLTT
jgi:hypothetical protein